MRRFDQGQRDRMMRNIGKMETRESDAFIALGIDGQRELARQFIVSALASGELALMCSLDCFDVDDWIIDNLKDGVERLTKRLAEFDV